MRDRRPQSVKELHYWRNDFEQMRGVTFESQLRVLENDTDFNDARNTGGTTGFISVSNLSTIYHI